MLIQLQPIQISLLWENIRQSVMKAHKVPSSQELKYSNKLLENLLSGKFQCWMVYNLKDDKREIVAIGVTSIIKDNLFGTKNLHILSLYGMRILTEETARETFDKLSFYARKNKCEKVIMTTNVGRVVELAKARGFNQSAAIYEIQV